MKPSWFAFHRIEMKSCTSEDKALSSIQLPEISFLIVLYLEARDVCSLGCCSKVLHSVCNSDYVWKELCRRRWPQQFVNLEKSLESCSDGVAYETQPSGCTKFPSIFCQGWKAQYIRRHKEMASKISGFLAKVDIWMMKKHLSISCFLEAVNLLNSMELSFGDVCSILFNTELGVHANLVGLQYSIIYLGVESKDARMAIISQGVAERQVCLKWSRKYKHFDHLFVPAQICYLTCSLKKIATDKEVLALLSRGRTANICMHSIETLPDEEITT